MSSVSLIIATRNRAQFLCRAIESARSAGAGVEIIVVDDASSESTAEVCRARPYVRYLRLERRQGLAEARNVGLIESRGEFITFLDDDDLRMPGSLDVQVDCLNRDQGAGLVYGQALVFKDNGAFVRIYPRECPSGDLFWGLLVRNHIPCGSVLFRRSCLSSVGLLDDEIGVVEDWDLWLRIAEIYPVIGLAMPVIQWRQSTPRSDQLTSRADHIVDVSIRQFREHWMKLPRAAAAPANQKKAVWSGFSENMTEHLVWESLRSLRYGAVQKCLADLVLIRRLHPLASARILRRRLGTISIMAPKT